MEDLRGQLVGAWRVTRYDDRASADEGWSRRTARLWTALILYHASGWMSVQIAGDHGGFDGYFGQFTIVEIGEQGDDIRGIVNHLILASSMPEVLTADPTRPFRITGDTLVLGDEETWRRICKRVG